MPDDAGRGRAAMPVRAGAFERGPRSTRAKAAPGLARIGAVGLQRVRDWGLAFDTAGPDGLLERRSPGPRFTRDDARRHALAAVIEEGPNLQPHGVVRWRRKDSAAWLFERFGISLDEKSVGRAVKQMADAKLSARPRHHQQDLAALTPYLAALTPYLATLTAFQEPPRPSESDPRRSADRHAARTPVAERGPPRPEEPDPAALGTPGQPACRPEGSAHGFRRHLRGDLPGERRGRRPRPALLRQAGHERASGRDPSIPALTLSRSLREPAGTSPPTSWRPTPSPCRRCRLMPPNSTRSRRSGRSCARTGSATGSSPPARTSPITAARLGTS